MLINENLFIDVDSCHRVASGNRLNGAVYQQKRVGDSIISTLFCAGSGTNIKGNISATILSSMATKHFERYSDITKVAEAIINVIAIDNSPEKSNSLSFTIAKVDNESNVSIVCYGTPQPIYTREDKSVELKPNLISFQTVFEKLTTYELYKFEAQTEDRIIFFNNLIVGNHNSQPEQSNKTFWESTTSLICEIINQQKALSANELSSKIILESYNYEDGHNVTGDQCCGIIFFRKPRKVLMCSGPPYDKEKDKFLAETIQHYNGNVIICGGTTAGIISRELNCELSVIFGRDPSGLPNESTMEGIDMITEGVLTLGRVKEILDSISEPIVKGRGIDIKLTRKLLNHDVIEIIVGTRINAMHQDPNIPIELELRRNVIKEIARILREKFFKEIYITYI